MPVQINEMLIRANVIEPNQGINATSSSTSSARSELANDDLIKECVEKVLEIINQKNER